MFEQETEELLEGASQVMHATLDVLLMNDASIIKKMAKVQAAMRDALIEEGFSVEAAQAGACNFKPGVDGK